MKSWVILAAVGSAISPLHANDAHFHAKVAPIFEKHCLACHSGGEPKGGLSLETGKQFATGGDSGLAFVMGKPDESLLIDLISGEEPQMPKDAKPLTAEEVAVIREWIAAGAHWPAGDALTDKKAYDLNWWSLRPLVQAAPPSIESDWIRTPIDAFILTKLEEQNLAPSPEADRRTLIRRLYFDLVGLPPSFEEVKAFQADADPRAYEKLVNRLLASPQYGERWGRHWLDVVHYGDTHGYDKDKVRENAWPYRDYVIRAFNEEKPYSRFIEEQLAGDVLYAESVDGVVATGFIAAGPFDFVGQVEVGEGTLAKAVTRNLDRDDMVATTLGAFNSMTAHCARCHNHKFDPITQDDYYSLQAVFAGVDRADRPFRHFVDGQERTGLVFAAATDFPANNQFTPTRGKPRPIHVLKRGNESNPSAEAAAGTCGYFPELGSRFSIPADAGEGARRVALARWLTDKRNPLTWRSIVNRVWQYHFGRGIVDSPNDFGRMGSLPSHPELLDWLAAEFRDGPQSIKSLHRLICSSAVYRQSSSGNDQSEVIDGGNQYLWRMNRRKLEAEAVRDSVLFVAGRLNLTAGGPGFRDFSFQDDESPRYRYDEYDPDDSQSYRRSIYRMIVRSVPNPWMTTLDCADASAVVPKRSETLTPLQSLAMMNNKFMVRMAEHFANRVSALGQNTSERIVTAFCIALAREPDQDELSALTAYADQYGLPNACRVIINMNEFVFVD
jgi:hypothetical protein